MKNIASITGKSLPRLGSTAHDFLDKSAGVMRDGTSRAREMVSRAGDRAVAYTHKRPVKSLFLAAVAGAVAVILAGVAMRRRH